jgi:molecular chaperone GrpE
MENDVTDRHDQDEKVVGHQQPDIQADSDKPDNGEVAFDEDGAQEQVELSEIETVRAERDSYFEQLQRSAADFTNYRRRNEQERSQLAAYVRKDVIAQFLPVIDDFDRAMSQIPDNEKSTGWSKGLEMIETKFKSILERCEVTSIDPLGEPFDPSRHEAVATEPGTSGEVVAEVYQKGYLIGDMLVRPAMVMTGDAVKTDA